MKNNTSTPATKKGFSLLEMLLVVAAIGILAGIVILALNPGKQLADTRNAQRKADVNTILNAVYQYAIDSNTGALPSTILAAGDCSTNTNLICTTGGDCNGGTNAEGHNLVDLAVLTNSGTYLVNMPTDPTTTTTNGTGYSIFQDANSRVTVCAPNAEGGTISASR